MAAWLQQCDLWLSSLLVPVACWILLSALDDLALFAIWFIYRPSVKPPPPDCPERPIAIFIPCWHEAAVIGKMLEHNISAIRYRSYHWFIGAYPNDIPTQRAVEAVAAKHPNVHLALCPHEGPTSKADCLNWIYQRMLLYESENDLTFELVLQHDAEDLVHPRSLEWVNFYSRFFGFIQTSVLALPTPVHQFTHGIYCDDFAYSHTVDLPVRYLLNGFVPSAGVGTAYRRDALERLAQSASNQVFAPECLTEDYENGYRLHRLGIRQLFIPPVLSDHNPLATREFFPQDFVSAWKQRTRWVTGIVFQGWQRHGWGRGWERYWFWRDRKGLIGNPLSVLANLMFCYGAASAVLHAFTGIPWAPAQASPLLAAVTAIGLAQTASRMFASSRYYGWHYALLLPLRTFPANVLNSASTLAAAWRFARAYWLNQPLRWVKTEHAYPSLAALGRHKRSFADVLLALDFITQTQLNEALSRKPPSAAVEDYLVTAGVISPEQLCQALSTQHNMPAVWFDPAAIRSAVAHCLPAQIIAENQVFPVSMGEGVLRLASPTIPGDDLQALLNRVTTLETQFVLVPPANFEALCRHWIDKNEAADKPLLARAAAANSSAYQAYSDPKNSVSKK
ncbi:MAG: glycosyl transferase family protein [Bdellovibrionales bacterium]|nr:glycosyl transferase family protein [Bdellovibrionales bacterium]